MRKSDLEREAEWLNDEFKRLTGEYPDPPVSYGVPMIHVESVRSVIFRSLCEQMKEAIEGRK